MTQKHSVFKRFFVVTTTYILLLSTLPNHSVIAAINEAFTYQGKIVNTDGTNLDSGDAGCISTGGADTCDFRVSLYTAVTGGTLIWQETKSDVELYDNDGIFNLTLDCSGTFSSCNQNGGPDFTSGDLFIQVEFDTSGNGDFAEGETFNPRRELTSTPYAFNAKTADNAQSLDGLDSGAFLRADTDSSVASTATLSIDGTIDVNGDVVISDEALVFDGSNTEFTLAGNLSINTNDLVVEKSSGYVGVGTTSPSVELEVVGNFLLSANADIEGYATIGSGSALNANSGLIIDYDTTYTALGQQLLVKGAITAATGTNAYGVLIDPDGITIPTGTSTLAASLYIDEPVITETGTLTNAATVYISSAATEADNNFALWVDSGYVQIDDNLGVLSDTFIGGNNALTAGIILDNSGSAVFNEQNNDSDFRVDGSGPDTEGALFVDASSGRVGINTTAPSAYLDLPAGTQAQASLRIRSGTEPSVPNEGDIFANGSTIYYNSSTGWVDLAGASALQDAYTEGSTIDVNSTALVFDLVSANFDIKVGEGTDTGDFRIWDGASNWFFLDENTSAISLGNSNASTGLSLTSGTNWSLNSTGAISGLTTISSSGDWTWGATTPTITINNGETFKVADSTDSFAINTTDSALSYSDGSNSVTFDLDSGPAFVGTARPTKTITLSPEYTGAVLTPFYGAGTDTNISGTMTSDAETTPASNIRSYYSWERNAATQHYYTVAVRVTLPQDFAAWTASNAIVVSYVTENATDTNSDVDVRVYLEGSGTVDASDLDNASVTWTTASFGSSDLDLWNAAGETGVIYLRLGSQSGNFARVGDIKLSYLASF